MRKIFCCCLALLSATFTGITPVGTSEIAHDIPVIEVVDVVSIDNITSEPVIFEVEYTEVECEMVEPEEIEPITYYIPYEDIELIALVTMAEAEGESVEGKRLVIDTILNRIDSVYFPNTAYDVIYQPNQFSSMWNGRVDRCQITDEVIQLVIEELEHRYNYETIFFNANHYSAYGCPLFQVGDHYFSSY